MSGYCTFCRVWHSGSCCHPARPIPPQVFTTCSTPEISTDYTALQQRHDALEAERDALRAEVEVLRKDAERLDWLAKEVGYFFCRNWTFNATRDGIDAAMSKETP